MKTYRIKEHSDGFGKSFAIQRKSIFRFWYNPEIPGFYDTEKELRDHIKRLQTPYKARIVTPHKTN